VIIEYRREEEVEKKKRRKSGRSDFFCGYENWLR
jgi:hypothetical protein